MFRDEGTPMPGNPVDRLMAERKRRHGEMMAKRRKAMSEQPMRDDTRFAAPVPADRMSTSTRPSPPIFNPEPIAAPQSFADVNSKPVSMAPVPPVGDPVENDFATPMPIPGAPPSYDQGVDLQSIAAMLRARQGQGGGIQPRRMIQ